MNYFPIKIRYTDNNEVVVISTSADIEAGRDFVVLEHKKNNCKCN